MRCIRPTSAATDARFYINGVFEKEVHREPTERVKPTSKKLGDVWIYRLAFRSSVAGFSRRRSIGDGRVGRKRYSELIGDIIEDDLEEIV